MSPMGKPFPRRDRGSTVDFGGWSGLSERASHKLRNEEGKLTRTQGKKRKNKTRTQAEVAGGMGVGDSGGGEVCTT